MAEITNKSAKEFIDQILGWKESVEQEPPNFISYNDTIKFCHEYSKIQKQELVNFLLEIEAWLTFNQTPNSENTNALRKDIKKLLSIE